MSLAKYLLIVAGEDNPDLDIHEIPDFLRHVLERVDWSNDLHFQTRTTIDTLDYTGHGLNQGSKVVIAAAGPKRRELARELPAQIQIGDRLHSPRVALPGILVLQGPRFGAAQGDLAALRDSLGSGESLDGFHATSSLSTTAFEVHGFQFGISSG